MSDTLEKLAVVIEQRKQADPDASYVAALYAKGLDAILKKVGEEATETVIAAKGGDTAQLVHETADLWFHTMVLLAYRGVGVGIDRRQHSITSSSVHPTACSRSTRSTR